jgi:hypothetical protein
MEELSPEQNYRFTLIEAVNQLIKSRNEFDVRIVNLAMSGEFAEIDALFEVGDVIPADMGYFEHCKDINVQELLKLYNQTNDLIHTLVNVNNIKEEELDLEVEE